MKTYDITYYYDKYTFTAENEKSAIDQFIDSLEENLQFVYFVKTSDLPRFAENSYVTGGKNNLHLYTGVEHLKIKERSV